MSAMDLIKNISNKTTLEGTSLKENVVSIKLDDITALAQVRSESNIGFAEANMGEDDDYNNQSLTALANNIRRDGLLQPILVRPEHEDHDLNKPVVAGKFIVVCGERRFRAMKLIRKWQEAEKEAGQTVENIVDSIDCIVRDDFANSLELLKTQLSENIQRTELETFETAFALAEIEKQIKEIYCHGETFIYVDKQGKSEEISYIKHNGEVRREALAQALSKSETWVSQMRAFTELASNAVNDEKSAKLLEFFKDGTISSSPRTGWDLIRIFKDYPDEVLKDLEFHQMNNEVVDRGIIQNLKERLDAETERAKQFDSENDNVEIPNLTMSSMGTDEAEDHSENNEYESDDNEYTESSEREHSEKPALAPAHQENDEHTAGLGNPNFTDKDTKQATDLSYTVDDSNEFEDESYENEDLQPELASINVIYTDENGNQEELILKLFDEDSLDNNIEGKVESLDGTRSFKVPLRALTLKSFNLK